MKYELDPIALYSIGNPQTANIGDKVVSLTGEDIVRQTEASKDRPATTIAIKAASQDDLAALYKMGYKYVKAVETKAPDKA
jgi:hypothetical protein